MPYKNSGHLHVGHPLLTHNIFTFLQGETLLYYPLPVALKKLPLTLVSFSHLLKAYFNYRNLYFFLSLVVFLENPWLS